MKKILFLLLLSFSSIAQTTIRVTAGQNLQTLIDTNPAETVYIVEGGVQNTNLDIGKKVTIFGTGYFLNSLQASPGVSTFQHIRIKPGGDGTYITGIQCQSINISANNVTIQRCYCENNQSIRLGYTGLGSGGYWNGTANNCMILQNYAARLEIISRDENGVNGSSANNFSVKGNIFYQFGFHLEGTISGEISNNTFNFGQSEQQFISARSTLSGCMGTWQCNILPIIFQNNILNKIIQSQWSCWYGGNNGNVSPCPINNYTTTNFRGNVFTQNFTNIPTNNVVNADFNTLFMGYPTNTNGLAPDARGQLSSNSPAKGVGVGGTDAGAFGGDTPYVLSGIPSIPVIYSLETSTQVPQGGTLQVQIKAKTNN